MHRLIWVLAGGPSDKYRIRWAVFCFSDMPGIQDTDDTTQPLLLIDTAGCDLHELDLPEEISKGNEGTFTEW